MTMSFFVKLGFIVISILLTYVANTTNVNKNFTLKYSVPYNSSIDTAKEQNTANIKPYNRQDENINNIKKIQKKFTEMMANVTRSNKKTSKKYNKVKTQDETPNSEVDIFDIKTDIDIENILEVRPSSEVAGVEKRQPVKLNMKQGLTMNQVLGVYSLTDAGDELCKNHSQEFSEALRAFEPWALKMFDASSKLQSGILFGNLFEFGSYKQCLEINERTSYGSIKGKHCTLKIIPDLWLIQKVLSYRNVSKKRWESVKGFVQNATLDWSVCIPESCGINDILPHFTKQILSLTEGLNIQIALEEKNCYTEYSQYKLSNVQIVIMCTILIYGLFIAGVTFADFRMDETKGSSDLDCVHGIRVMSTCYVIVGHRFLIMMFYPIINSLYIIDWILYYRSTAITGGTLCVDTFFMISGMLVSLGYFKQAANGKINWFLFYIYRYVRITIPLAIAVMFHAIFTEYFGSGPLWNDMVEVIENPCREYWWAVLLHIQNYVHPFPLCMTQTWYLTCDMQYYFLSPIILIPFGRHKAFGYANYVLIYVLSVAVSFYLAWTNQYNGGVPVTNQLFSTKFFQRYYITPHTRASTYLIGLGFGYLVYKTSGDRVKIGNLLAVAGWMICATTMLASLVGCHVFFQEEHDYNRIESSIFLSFSRSTWTLGIVWMVWACINGYGGPINFVLSLHIFRVIGRISYGMYLLHMVMQFIMSGSLKVPLYFSDWNGIFFAVADLFIIAVIGFVFTLMFDSPIAQILSVMYKSASNKQKIRPTSKEEMKSNGYTK